MESCILIRVPSTRCEVNVIPNLFPQNFSTSHHLTKEIGDGDSVICSDKTEHCCD